MREIKFRAWDKLKKKVVEVAGVNFVEGIVMLWKNVGSVRSTYYAELDSVELIEFTGLKDKNGTEIYEGDILSREAFLSWLVKWHDGGFVSENITGVYEKRHYPLTQASCDQREVIGNIYENSELINA